MALSVNTPRAFELGSINSLPVLTAVRVFEGSAVGADVTTGFARPLVAGDPFCGFAESEANNTSGASGDIRVRVRTAGEVRLAIAALAITDIGAPVYASDDGTFTLTQSTNTYIGKVVRWEATGFGIIAFSVPSNAGVLTVLTDNTAGAANNTLEAIADLATAGGNTYTDAAVNAKLLAIRNNFADLAAKVNALIRMNQ